MQINISVLTDIPRFWLKRRKFDTYTMIRTGTFIENLRLVKTTLKEKSLDGGAIIECGTWKGGMAAALIEICGPNRPYYFFDSFAGLPPAEEIDGKLAPELNGALCASMADIKNAISLTGCPTDNVTIIPGFFQDSLPNFPSPSIAVLRLDGDWYASTMICLKKFWDHVLPGGIIIIDDYYMWDGCSCAVHDFLSQIKAKERIDKTRFGGIAYIRRLHAS
jgi:O-methyltransferase